jgi:CheY-like chemotaxis protein
MPPSPRLILCVDDDEDDRELVCVTIKELDPRIEVVYAENGVEAINFLSKAKEDKTLLPCLVIMDINMPKMDGKQTIAIIKKDEHLHKLPVVIYSTFINPEDRPYYDEHGVELVTKPQKLSNIKEEVKKLLRYCAEA